MKSPGSTEANQCCLSRILPPLGRNLAQGSFHLMVGDFDDPQRHFFHTPVQLSRQTQQCLPGSLHIDGRFFAKAGILRQTSKNHMGIRHRCINSTATISRRSGIRTCTVRAHPQGTSGIDPGDGAASGTHGMDVDHRHRDGDTIHQRIPLSEMSGVATDQTDIGARSTHVKGDRHTSIATLLSCHHSARRTGEHRLHRLTGQCGPGSGRTGGIHHPQLCRAQSLSQFL